MFDNMETHMDFSGQQLAEQIFHVIIIVFGVIGFLVGYVFQQLSYSMIILFSGCLLASLITIPPWSMYRKNPIKWLEPYEKVPAAASGEGAKKKHLKRR